MLPPWISKPWPPVELTCTLYQAVVKWLPALKALSAALVIFLYAYLNLNRWHGNFSYGALAWIFALFLLGAVAVFDPEVAAGLARLSFAATAAVGVGLIILLGMRGFDRAIMLVPSWLMILVWLAGAWLAVTGALDNDIVQPARARGYARIWLCGISLGGYGSLLYAAQHSASIDGLFVMAAFLGRRDLPAHIAQAGGLAAWDGQMAGADAHDLALWRWLRGYADPAVARQRPPLLMGWGEDDRFVMSNRLVGATLPPGHVFTTGGGHDWPAWQRLWAAYLDQRPWQGSHG